MLDPRWYEGREPALVKHTFLDTYMPAQIPKVVSWADTFVYVDLFAGPWQSQSDDFSDTSFGIALRHMTEAKAKQAQFGKSVKMVAHLVEKNPKSFPKLVEAVKRFPEVETQCYFGTAEQHVDAVTASIRPRAFRLVVIDPTGIPDVRRFRRLIEPLNTEVLLNFMFQFANRFASSQDRMPPLEGWLGNLQDGGEWRSIFGALSGAEREAAISERARLALKEMGNYQFAPALTVDETHVDRTLYKLIFLTRHSAGMKVFRAAHLRALETQATYRSAKKAENRQRQTGMDDMFSETLPIEPGERSAKIIAAGQTEATQLLLQLLASKAEGITWKEIWPAVLDGCVVSHRTLSEIAQELWLQGEVVVPAWQSRRVKRPKDDFRFHLAAR